MRRARVPLVVLTVAWIGIACTTTSEPSAGPSPASTPGPTPSSSDSVTGEADDSDAGDRIAIQPDAAKAVGLPPLGFSLSIAGTGMSGAPLRDGDYLHLSGPPGGPLSLRIAPAKVGAELRALVAEQSAGASAADQQVELLGAPRPALAWVSGESLAQTSWCAVVVAPATAQPGDPALLLVMGVGGSAPDCAGVVGNSSLAKVLASLELEAG